MNKQAKELLAYAKDLGWERVRLTNEGHPLLRHPVTGSRMTLPATPHGGKRGTKNARQDLKRWAETPRPR